MKIRLIQLHLENFKGVKDMTIPFTDKTAIRGENGSGKTTILDAFLWLLFDKNSAYATDFEARPLNEDGTAMHYVDIVVSAILNIDGNETELKKTQKERWVKQRGSEKAEYKGNENIYEVDGYPKSVSEYKEFIKSLSSEEMFKIITNPTYFPSMKWKEQREILMQFASSEKNVDIAKAIGGFDDILLELSKAPSTDDIFKKFKAAKRELENKQVEIPVRIDELEKQIVDYDVAELELQKKELERRLADNPLTSDKTFDLKEEIMSKEFELSGIKQKSRDEYNNKRRAIADEIFKEERALKETESNNLVLKREIESLARQKDGYSKEFEELNAKYLTNHDLKFDEKSTFCPTCNQILPESRIKEITSEFEKKKADTEKDLIARGKEMKKLISSLEAEIKDKESHIVANIDNSKLEALRDELAKVAPENFKDNKVTELEKEIADLKSKLATMQAEESKENAEISTLKCDLDDVNEKLFMVANNNSIGERVLSLKAELKDTAQKIANCEKVIYLTEQFVKAKLERITVTINSKFKLVKFKLFDVAINGGIADCCECTIDGVPYSDLNSASKIKAGLDIINTLSEHYNAYAPIFIDNRESCTFIPDMSTQVISLYVDPMHKELFVEKES
jgi:DNA repair protein SbcC/Rad50